MNMGFIRLLTSLTGVTIVTSTIMLGVSFIFSLIMNEEEFGNFSFFNSMYFLCLNFVSFGTSMSIVVYRYKIDGLEYKKLVSNAFYMLIPFVTLLLLMVLMILANFIDGLLDYKYFLVLLYSAFSAIFLLVVNYLRVEQRIKLYSRYFIAYTVSNAMFAMALFYFYSSVDAVFVGFVASTLIFCGVSYCFFIKENKLSLFYREKSRLFFESLRYGIPVCLSSFAMSFMVLGDKLILGYTVSSEQLGKYAVVSLLASTSLFLVNNFASAWGGYLAKNLVELTSNQVFKLFINCHKYFVWVVFSFALMLMVNYAIYFFIYEERLPGQEVNLVLLLSAYSLYGCCKYYMGFMNYYHKNKFVLMSSVFGIVVIVLVYLVMFESIGVNAMPIALLSGFLLQLMFCFIYTFILLKALENA